MWAACAQEERDWGRGLWEMRGQLATAVPPPRTPPPHPRCLCCRGFAVLPPIAWPAFPLLQQALDAYKAASDAERQRLDRAMLGPAQLDWIRSSTRTSVARDTKWQLYAAGTVLQDQWMGDLEGAVERQADPAKKALWQSELQNLTGTDPTATTSIYTKLAFLAPLKGAVIPVR